MYFLRITLTQVRDLKTAVNKQCYVNTPTITETNLQAIVRKAKMTG